MNDLVKLSDLKEDIINLHDFKRQCEKKLFDWSDVQNRTRDEIAEYYKLSVNVMMNELKLYKDLSQRERDDTQTEMIIMLCSDMTKEEKSEMIDFLIKLKKKKEVQ
jgi:hypothetical protein